MNNSGRGAGTPAPGTSEPAAGDRAGDAERSPYRPRLLPVLGGLSALITLSLAQPVLDLLAGNPEFFVARSAPPVDVVGVAVVVALVLPAVLSLLAWGSGFVHPVAGRFLAGFFVAVATAPLVLRMTRGVGVPGWTLVVLALAVGVAVAVVIDRSAAVQSVLPFGIALPVLLTGWFAFVSPAAELIAPDEVELAPKETVVAPSDVVFFIFDEFPLATILDDQHEIDRRAFPNIARLAETSTWYSRATTVHRATTQAVPAILDGRYRREKVLPTASDRPENLFTLVGSDLRVVAEEAVSEMCPAEVCNEESPPAGGRIEALANDVAILTGHMILPRDLAAPLPPVDEGWGFFGEIETQGVEAPDTPEAGTPAAGRPGTETPGVEPTPPSPEGRGEAWVDPGPAAEAFIDGIRRSGRPTLFFKHVLLPHGPWRYLPSGQKYPHTLPVPGTRPIPGRRGTTWTDDEWLVTQGYQRHILQAMNVDRLIGRALDRLTESGLLERALVVVVSDHGTAFTPSRPRRAGGGGTQGEVGPVPLFIKFPGQTEARVDDRAVQTVDVLPTIADVLDAEPGWALDGISLLDRASYIHPRERPGLTRMARRFIRGPSLLPEVVKRKMALFGHPRGGVDPYLLAPEGTRPLLDRPVPAETGQNPGSAILDDAGALRNADLDGELLPTLLEGEINLNEPSAERPRLAVAVNGTVASITLGYEQRGTTWSFQAMLPPPLLREGRNDVEVYLLDEANGGWSFSRLYPD